MSNLERTLKRALRFLRSRGVIETGRKTVRHFSRQIADRRFAARMRLPEEELARQREERFSRPLRFSVIVPLYNTPPQVLKEMVDSVAAQTYADWELCLADGSDESHAEVGEFCRARAAEDPRIRYQKLEGNGGISENSNACLRMAEGEYCALFDHDDLLTPDALYEMRRAIDRTGADFLYSDEMIFRSPRPSRVIGIRLKPGFSPDSLLTNNYICHLTVFSRELLERAGGFRKRFDGSQDHDLILRLTGRARGIAHISRVLYLWRSLPSSVASDIYSKAYAIDAGRSAVEAFLREEKGLEDAAVESTRVFPTMYRVRWPIAGEPSVRVILDARRERGGTAEKLRALKESAGWDRCAWTVIGDAPAEGAEGAEVLTPGPGESRRALWSRAAAESAEEYLLFADGIPEAEEDGWLRELLGWAQQSHVGAVAPKLLFRRRPEVRQAGLILGMGPMGLAGRLYFRGDAESEDAYFGQLAVAENVSAVTDMLLVSAEKLRQAGGFCGEYADALFDTDLCLRLLEKGYYNVCTPHALLRMGSPADVRFDAGREYASYPADAEVFRRRNAGALKRGDPYYNPNLSLKYENWRVSVPEKPAKQAK